MTKFHINRFKTILKMNKKNHFTCLIFDGSSLTVGFRFPSVFLFELFNRQRVFSTSQEEQIESENRINHLNFIDVQSVQLINKQTYAKTSSENNIFTVVPYELNSYLELDFFTPLPYFHFPWNTEVITILQQIFSSLQVEIF